MASGAGTPARTIRGSDARIEDRKKRLACLRDAERHNEEHAALKVMTRNLYIGADLTPVYGVTSPQDLPRAVAAVFAMVQATDFPGRARALADEIVDVGPHLVGLQEVNLFRSQTPADLEPRPNAETVAYDFLGTLLDELAARGRRYAAVATVTNVDAEVPCATPTDLQDLRVTDYDVLLAPADLPEDVFSVANARSGNFEATFDIVNPVLGTLPLRRGWAAADVTLRGRTVRVVNTHLERFDPDVQVAQGDELLAGPLSTPLPAILLGDLNSAVGPGAVPGQSNTATYRNTLEAGFADAWTAKHGTEAGFTCCHDEDLSNARPKLTERIDFVLARGEVRVAAANRVGHEPEDRTRSGLWPSDHAGVWAALRL